MRDLVTIRGLLHTYLRGTPFAVDALHGVDLDVREGEVLGIVGPTRSGKSTLIQYLNGIFRPSKPGIVQVDGMDTSDDHLDVDALRQKVGLVFQYPEYQLFAPTVREDVGFGPKNLGLDPDEVEARVNGALQAVELSSEEYAGRDIFALSGGEKRRVAIAGVLALRPEILVLDEPVAGLDPRGRDSILAWIRRLHEKEGVTIVIATNSLEEVVPLLSRVAVMIEGRIAAEGSPADMLTDARLLAAARLNMPPTVELMMRLREKGQSVPLDVFTVEDAARIVARLTLGGPPIADGIRGAAGGNR